MRYLDSGDRDPGQALGSWLEHVLADTEAIDALRWQSGFFTADILGFFLPVFEQLGEDDGTTGILVGSNDGTTQRADAEVLLRVAGPPRPHMRLGIVKFATGYFHAKTVHVIRKDGSSSAYVGSANLTGSGVNALHVEAGLVLDSRDGDDPAVLAEIGRAVDAWFEVEPEGLHLIETDADIERLCNDRVLDVPRPPSRRAAGGRGERHARAGATLRRLTASPPLPPHLRGVLEEAATPAAEAEAPDATEDAVASDVPPVPAPAAGVVAEWRKQLPASDAQRKPSGNQSGAIALTKAGYDIDAQTYFRDDFFSGAQWLGELTNTGEIREAASLPFAVTVRGDDQGVLSMRVTYAGNRESGQHNYTTLLHLGPLADLFGNENLTGHWLTLQRLDSGSYTLDISAP